MLLHLNPNNGVPIYRQLVQQLRQRIVSGQLKEGEQLPSVRDLSEQLKINLLTAAKAYQLLESEGLVESRRGLGTFVRQDRPKMSGSEKRKSIASALDQVITEARHLQLSKTELLQMISERFDHLS